MGKNEFLKEQFGVSEEIIDLIDSCEKSVKPQFERIEEIAQLKEENTELKKKVEAARQYVQSKNIATPYKK